MAKAPKESNTLISSEGSGFFYVNRKNKKKSKGDNKLKLKKYDPRARKHVLFEEKKLSRLKKKYVAGKSGSEKSGNNNTGNNNTGNNNTGNNTGKNNTGKAEKPKQEKAVEASA